MSGYPRCRNGGDARAGCHNRRRSARRFDVPDPFLRPAVRFGAGDRQLPDRRSRAQAADAGVPAPGAGGPRRPDRVRHDPRHAPARDRAAAAGVRAAGRHQDRPDPAHRPPHLLPVQGHRVLLDGDRGRPGRGERDLGLPGAERRVGLARGLRGLLLERHGRVVRRGRARRGPHPRPVPPGGRAPLLPARPRPARRHRAGRDDQSAAALRDRPAEPLLHPGRRRPPGPIGGERQAHRVPLQGHGLLLDGQRGRPQARRRRSGPTRRPKATPPPSAATCRSCTTT